MFPRQLTTFQSLTDPTTRLRAAFYTDVRLYFETFLENVVDGFEELCPIVLSVEQVLWAVEFFQYRKDEYINAINTVCVQQVSVVMLSVLEFSEMFSLTPVESPSGGTNVFVLVDGVGDFVDDEVATHTNKYIGSLQL